MAQLEMHNQHWKANRFSEYFLSQTGLVLNVRFSSAVSLGTPGPLVDVSINKINHNQLNQTSIGTFLGENSRTAVLRTYISNHLDSLDSKLLSTTPYLVRNLGNPRI
jgi:hypothetical protein